LASLATAVDLLRQGAEQKAEPAHLDLGRCYAAGEGIEQNRIEAFAWLSVAMAEGWYGADEELNKLIPDMSPEELEAGKALAEQYIPKFRCCCDR
jgi:TPR repeat protein